MGDIERRLRIPERVAETIRGMHPDLKKKIRASLEIFLNDPEEGKALSDELSGMRSFKVGKFRIVYRVRRNALEIVAIGPRQRIYEETYRLLRKTE